MFDDRKERSGAVVDFRHIIKNDEPFMDSMKRSFNRQDLNESMQKMHYES